MTDLASSSYSSSGQWSSADGSSSGIDSARGGHAVTAFARERDGALRLRRPGLGEVDRADLTAAVRLLRRLGPSPDAAVVFADLAALLVPAVCDAARAAATCVGGPVRRSDDVPVDDGGPDIEWTDTGWTMTIRPPLDDGVDVPPDTVPVLTCSWRGQPPTVRDVAVVELAVRYAAVLVRQSRQSQSLASRQRQVESLRVALDSNRLIGAAVGVLMATRQLTYPQAFELLVRCSQTTNTKLVAVADGVLHTGCLP